MRLSEQEQHIIREAILAEDSSATVYLFGSRTDDNRKGGDIDLFLETGIDTGLLQMKARILNRLWKQLGPQRIDLLVHRRGQPLTPFEIEAQRNGVQL